MTFSKLTYFVLAVVPLVLGLIYVLGWRKRQKQMAEGGSSEQWELMTRNHSTRLSVAQLILSLTALLLLVVALAGPQWGERQQQIERRGIDIVFALDISRSMLAPDIAPSRFNAARAEVDRILNFLDGDRVGLVAFAGLAFTQCPLTGDYGAIRRFLRTMSPEDMPVQGTAIGRAIEEATNLLTGRRRSVFQDKTGEESVVAEVETEPERGHDQIIVVISDGEDHETVPEEAAREAVANGIRVFTVAIGTETGTELPTYAPDGSRRGTIRNQDGEIVLSSVQLEGMNAIASAGEGIALTYNGEGSIASILAEEVDRLESAELESILSPEREERYYLFVAPALLLLLIGLALSERRRNMSSIGWSVSLLLLLSLPPLWGCGDNFVYESEAIDQSLALSQDGQPDEALDLLRTFRSEIAPENLLDEEALSYNEGVILIRSENSEEAYARLLTALGSDDDEVRFRAYYNLGNLAYMGEDWQEAHDRFIQALEIRPGDDDARWNLEMALRRLFPPCSLLEDAHEENDTQAEAAPFPMETGTPAEEQEEEVVPQLICGGDADWYRLPAIGPGATLEIMLEFTRLRDDVGRAVLPSLVPSDGISVQLYTGDVEILIDADPLPYLENPITMVDAQTVQRQIGPMEITQDMIQSGELLLEIGAILGMEYEYSLELQVTPPCYELEDTYEENDSASQARSIYPGQPIPLQICREEEDWYALSVTGGDSVFIDIQAIPPQTQDGTQADQVPQIPLVASLFEVGSTEPIREVSGMGELMSISLVEYPESSDFVLRIRTVDGVSEGGYAIELFSFPPCILGDDPFEENDDWQSAQPLDPGEGPQRHLRICDGDEDWFSVALEAETDFSVTAEYGQAMGLQLVLTGPDSSTVIATGTSMPVDAAGDVMVRHAALEAIETAGTYNIHVSGEPGFYNLSFPDQQEQDSQGDDSQEEEESEDSEQSEDSDQSEDSEQPEDSEQEEQADSEQEESENGEEEPNEPEQTEEEARREDLRQLLESLAEDDINLQLHQALQNSPPASEYQW